MRQTVPNSSAQRQSQFHRFFPHPTGKNGFEEYLQAADLLQDQNASQYDTWFFNLRPAQGRMQVQTAPPEGVQLTDSYAEVERKYRKRFQKVLALVKSGNAKPAQLPSKLDNGASEQASDFPVYARFRQVARFTAHAGDAEFEDGKEASATQILFDSLKFSSRVSTGSEIALFAGYGCEFSAVHEFSSQVKRLSPSSAAKVVRYCANSLTEEPAEIAVVSRAFEVRKAKIHDIVSGLRSHPQDIAKLELMPHAVQRLKSLSGPQLEQLAKAIEEEDYKWYDLAIRAFKGSGKAWTEFTTVTIPASTEPLVAIMVSRLGSRDVLTNLMKSAIRRREGLRMLILKVRVAQYLQKQHRLPSKLADCAKSEDLMDPFSGKPYRYLVRNGSFDVQTGG